MEDLSGKYKPVLTPTSQEGGGMAYDNTTHAHTAPGTPPVTPMKTPQGDKLPLPVPDVFDGSDDVPLSGQHGRTEGNPAPKGQDGGGGWTNTDDMPDSGRWRRIR